MIEFIQEWIKSLGTQPVYTLNHYINTRIQSKSPVSFDEPTNHIRNILQYSSILNKCFPNSFSRLGLSLVQYQISPLIDYSNRISSSWIFA